jgi:deoxyribodipyrimidine photo-lyase
MIQNTRIKLLNSKKKEGGDYVLYWMQASQRSENNHALEFAVRVANDTNLPIMVYFGLTDRFPEANRRHYYFMLQGLREVQASLKDRSIQLVVRAESPEVGVIHVAKRAAIIVCDCGYLKIYRKWRRYVAERANCPVIQVESECVIPVKVASNKEEYTAATFRPKIIGQLKDYLVPLKQTFPRINSLNLEHESLDLSNIEEAISGLDLDRDVLPVNGFQGGTTEARKRLRLFIENKLDEYSEKRNDPNADGLSEMSPYLHFGQISPLEIALAVDRVGGPGKDAYLEELIVRRELAINYVYYNPQYDSFDGLPTWVQKTLRDHTRDIRGYIYSTVDLERAVTHDKYWNAAQREMIISGKMHSYMRMYWGKKIIEWTANPEEAFRTGLYLNNKYELDGRDPNGFTGIAWCFGKHDRPWASRSIFGNIRYMNENGLRRKFDADLYVAKVAGQF